MSVEVWSVRSCLSEGIKRYAVASHDGRFAAVVGLPIRLQIGKDCSFNRDEATNMAERKRVKRLAALKREMFKLEAVRFDRTPGE